MRFELVLWFFASVAVSAVLVGWIRRLALKRGVLDIPNERSSHSAPTPRGGGVAIVVTSLAGAVAFWLTDRLDTPGFIALFAGGLLVGLIGYLDDLYRLTARVRLLVHVLAAGLAVWQLGGLPLLQFGEQSYDLAWFGDLLALVAIVWMINLFNFMDGIDGIAASEAAFIAGGAVLLGLAFGLGPAAIEPALPLAGASMGFLLWNWPPAKIFMGDAGSGYLGFAIATLTLSAGREQPVLIWVWLILGAVFIVDATVTLSRRFLAGARLSQAHREHLYQRLAIRYGRHGVVTTGVLAIDLFWLAPLAALALRTPDTAAWLVGVAFAPLIVLAVFARVASARG